MLTYGKTSSKAARGYKAEMRVAGVAAALGCAFGLALSAAQPLGKLRPGQPPIAAASPAATFDPSRFILNALLVPALDADALPLRWADPRPALGCGPLTAVSVNRKPLVVGALVPVKPFELEWHADGCRPFGANGPQFDGGIRLTVFREDWGFSALVEPSGLRFASATIETTPIQRGTASLPQFVDAGEPVEFGADGSLP